ncbi:hypothetical protein [Congzhengia sp.]|uniref:hypothetical protein n=1 Tax=Congzhengia sp. TaxID=2944168 RepID=UPI003077A5B7
MGKRGGTGATAVFCPERMGPLQSSRRETGFAGKRNGSETGGYSANSGMELSGACRDVVIVCHAGPVICFKL